MKFLWFETIATAPPQKVKMLLSELCEDLRHIRNDSRIKRRSARLLLRGLRCGWRWSDSG
jgi:hypothetical protein